MSAALPSPARSEPPSAIRAQQARSRRSHDEIRRAGYELLVEGGPDALTIAAVAERSGMAVGSVYRRFGDKEGLLASIQHAFTEEFLTVFEGRLRTPLDPRAQSEASAADAVRAAVRAASSTFRENEALLRVFLLLGTRNPSVYAVGADVSVRGKNRFVERLQRLNLAHPDRAAAADFAYRLVYAACAHRVTHGANLESDLPLGWDAFQSELELAVVGYLLHRP